MTAARDQLDCFLKEKCLREHREGEREGERGRESESGY